MTRADCFRGEIKKGLDESDAVTESASVVFGPDVHKTYRFECVEARTHIPGTCNLKEARRDLIVATLERYSNAVKVTSVRYVLQSRDNVYHSYGTIVIPREKETRP